MTTAAQLRFDNVECGYGDTTVLRGVDIAVPEGAAVALIGPNGAGKSTLLRAAAGLLRPTSGRITMDGQDVTSWTPERRARLGLGYVPEGRGIFRSLTVRQNLRLQAMTVTEEEAIDRAVKAFPVLGDRLGQIAGTLSGGQQQMLAIARSYVERPRFMLFDEVSMGLAPVVVDDIFAFLETLAGTGVGILFVEQFVTRALELADYVFVLGRGRVAFCGEPSELDEQDLFAQYIGVGS